MTAGVDTHCPYCALQCAMRLEVDDGTDADAVTVARRQAAAAIGIISAIGAYGGFLVPRTYGWSTASFGSIVPALYVYVGLYVVMLAVTWAFYLRRGSEMGKVGV